MAASRIRRRVRAAAEPHEVWNAFVDLLATEDAASLEPIQRMAQLAFWYDAEVQNGGHDQYFDTFGFEHVSEVVAALAALGLACQADVLRRAVEARSAGSSGDSSGDDGA